MATLLFLIISICIPAALASLNTLPGCNDTCGAVSIPYPFGFSPGCYLPGFNISCSLINGSYKPFLYENELVSIDLSSARARIYNEISSICHSPTGNITSYAGLVSLVYTPYRFSDTQNKILLIGCETFAFVDIWQDSTWRFTGGCVSECANLVGIVNGTCSGIGCCQTVIPKEMNCYRVEFDPRYNNSMVYKFNPCSYVVLMEDAEFVFDTSYITTKALTGTQAPLVLDWAIRNQTCETARADASFACVSRNSECVDSTNGAGYWCNCSSGYQGNPYLLAGCQDIDECAAEKNPCNKKKCHNLPGSYRCSCSLLMRATPDTIEGCQLYVPYLIGAIITLGFGTGFVILLSYFAIEKRIKLFEKRRQEKIKHKFFIQNRGLLLEQLIDSHDDTTEKMRIFRLDELEKATNKFDDALVLGRGGHGKVYKGILSDQRVVAIKRSTDINKAEIDQFINEVAILSHVNHRNVVKLFGCCLETEVPLLVYEFISNGTLYNHLHAVEHCSLTWKHRLRIALEAAGAISYLHSSASVSVFHRDIKSANILLDDYFTVKVSDFGISRSVQLDQTGINTNIVGTLGYIDPEYFDTGRLTQKSDVYSFGVILVEVLTREKPIGASRIFEGGSLTANFNIAMRENRVFEIIDPEVVYEENRIEIEAVAKIAEMCLKKTGEERPTMKEMEMQLEALWRSNKQRSHPWTAQSSEQSQQMPLDLSTELDTTYYSFQVESQSNIL